MSAIFQGRKLRKFNHECTDYCDCPVEPTSNAGEADLVTSELESGMHMPVIDLDLPCQLVPSATPGHYHLYIDKAMPWSAFSKVLIAMEEAGIVQSGYLNGAMRRGFAAVRVPWKPKAKPRPEPEPF